MSGKASVIIRNQLLECLPGPDYQSLLGQCTQVQLSFGEVLCRAGESYKYLYFPVTGFISLVRISAGQKPLEVGMIGSEGMLGATLALDSNRVPLQAIVQGSGLALRISAAKLRQQLKKSSLLRFTLHRYLYIQFEQLAQTALCNSFHSVQARLARWLLMSHDRAHANHFHLTHSFLAAMLGVRRSAVSIAAGKLQSQQLIRYSRGKIQILSRKGMEAISCECYQADKQSYSDNLPPAERQTRQGAAAMEQ